MINFPAICLDNFYDNPDEIREFALKQEFTYPECGTYPGKRTQQIHELDRKLFDSFCLKLFSIFYDFSYQQVNWNVSTTFQIVEPNNDPLSPKNLGWIHKDNPDVAAGIIYLTPNINLNCGTSLFNLHDETKLDNTHTKQEYFKYKKNPELYDELIVKHNSAFTETARFNNIYNRLVLFDSSVYHGVNSFYSNTEPRLTQVFFISGISAMTPVQRSKTIK